VEKKQNVLKTEAFMLDIGGKEKRPENRITDA